MGMNPAGTGRSVQRLHGEPWFRYFTPPQPGLWAPLDANIGSDAREELRFRTSVGLAEAAFDRARRDVESVGLAFIDPVTAPEPGPFPNQETARQALRSIIRTMGRQKRYQGGWDESDSAPRSVTNLCERLAARNGVSKDEVLEWARTSLNREGLLVEPMKWVLAIARMGVRLSLVGAGDTAWVCQKCQYVHLHPSAGVCANDLCTGTLIESPQAEGANESDYIGWLARLEPRPMAVERAHRSDEAA